MEKIRSLLTNKVGGNSNNTSVKTHVCNWILDSGCSHHMTSRHKLLTNIWKTKPSRVGLPDGSDILASEHGCGTLSSNFVLKDVLCVPNLTCDLISVKQLIKENNCFVTFYADYCVIQDQSTRMKIGRGEHRDGVYYLKTLDREFDARTRIEGDGRLWHPEIRSSL